MQDTILKKYKDVICKNCTKENCKKGIVIYTQTINTGERTKEELCVKCADYKKRKHINEYKTMKDFFEAELEEQLMKSRYLYEKIHKEENENKKSKKKIL